MIYAKYARGALATLTVGAAVTIGTGVAEAAPLALIPADTSTSVTSPGSALVDNPISALAQSTGSAGPIAVWAMNNGLGPVASAACALNGAQSVGYVAANQPAGCAPVMLQ